MAPEGSHRSGNYQASPLEGTQTPHPTETIGRVFKGGTRSGGPAPLGGGVVAQHGAPGPIC